MKSIIIGMFAETSIQTGGRSTGFVDLAVARESISDYPMIAGSSIGGALRNRAREWLGIKGDYWTNMLNPEVENAFGSQDYAATLIFSDAKLLLLPIQSHAGTYKLATCNHLLERFHQDIEHSGYSTMFKIPKRDIMPDSGKIFTDENGNIFLEEHEFEIQGKVNRDTIESIGHLMPNDASKERLSRQLAILNDKDFKWFARYGLPINARIFFNRDAKISQNLWYEETLPQGSLFYSLLLERREGAIDLIKSLMLERPYLQVGRNTKFGYGRFSLRLLDD